MDLFSKFTSQFKKEEPAKPDVHQEPAKEPEAPILDQWEAYMKINGHIPLRDFKMLVAREATVEELKTMSEFEKKQRRQGDKQKGKSEPEFEKPSEMIERLLEEKNTIPEPVKIEIDFVSPLSEEQIILENKELAKKQGFGYHSEKLTTEELKDKYGVDVSKEHAKLKNNLSPEQFFKELMNSPVNYDSMPQGMKEAQQRNGIKDHRLGLFDNIKELDIPIDASKTVDQGIKHYQNTGIIYYETPVKIKCYVSIDPGQKGGIVAMTDQSVVGKWEMPLLNERLDKLELNRILTSLTNDYNCIMIIEDVHSIYGTSSGSNFSFGYICGQIDMVVSLLRVKRYDPQPKFWQKNVWIDSDKVYKPLKPEQKKASIDTKATSSNAAKRLFPNEDLRGNIIEKYYADNSQNRKLNRAGQLVPSAKENDHDGIVDALLMCEVARKLNY